MKAQKLNYSENTRVLRASQNCEAPRQLSTLTIWQSGPAPGLKNGPHSELFLGAPHCLVTPLHAGLQPARVVSPTLSRICPNTGGKKYAKRSKAGLFPKWKFWNTGRKKQSSRSKTYGK
ncbi:hypothetical protein AVEN_42671-1 [Araneus ventricosus]|uniref:Uncharacterized protein n=1 Tax=Araneus ventricosus TaxID=182803 RepID=A0A4Y2BPL7_ARAVE|nr:hypothetical protein AVEN_42671-1 [Araneus ventricosus]